MLALPVTAASASTILGTTSTSATIPCQAGAFTAVQVVPPPSTTYAAGSNGVITQWSFAAGPDAIQVRLGVLRPIAASSYELVGESAVATTQAGVVNTYATRIPVRAGDALGLTPGSAGACLAASGGATVRFGPAALGVGQSAQFVDGSGALPVAAVLEADGDGDGYGDETQDLCATQPSTHGACDLDRPDTTITKGPQPTSRTSVRFVFVSDEPGGTFECRLKGKNVRSPQLQEYRPCSSPRKYKKLRAGGYMFQARAIDAAGNRDLTPDHWKFRIRPS
jgi:hypothetical protein